MASHLTPLYKQSYRKLAKAAAMAFGKDLKALQVAKTSLRVEFLKNSHITDPVQLKACYFDVEDIEQMLRFNIVQGTKNDNGNYGEFIPRSQIDRVSFSSLVFFIRCQVYTRKSSRNRIWATRGEWS